MRRAILLVATAMVALFTASGVALAVNKIGTDGPDTLQGTNGDDNLLGKGGNDTLYALAGEDNLLGGSGKDVVLGGNEERALGGDKNLVGGSGNDHVRGGKGSDNVVGGEGNDFLFPGDGDIPPLREDNLSGGGGNDVLIVINGPAAEDVVVCGRGFDRVLVDREDVVAADCEKVVVGFGSFDAFFESIPQSFFEGLP